MTVYHIRPAGADDISHLAAIELACAALFPEADLPTSSRADVVPRDLLTTARADGRLWVAAADGQPVGFALARFNAIATLLELDVHPRHGRRGLGRRLVQAVAAAAAARGYSDLHLTTFRHIAWNAPFYQRLGFVLLDDGASPPAIAADLASQRAAGLANRVAMRLALGTSSVPTADP